MEKMLAFFATALLLSTAVSATETSTPVLDMDGDELQAGVRYYMISAIRGAGGGGLTLRPKFGTICPLYVAQEPSDLMEGLPLVLHPANTNDKIIYTSTDLNVEVIKNTYFCRVSPVWKLDLDTQSVEGSRIGIGGVLGNPGEETMSNWFKIEQIAFRGIYKISYCPSVVKGSTVPCGDVGLAEGRFLGLTDNRPFYLVFKKADTITKTSDTEIYGEIRKVI